MILSVPYAAGAALCACLAFTQPIAAQDPKPPAQKPPAAQQPDPLAELKKQMKARYPDLERLRDAAKVGETWNGEVALVKAAYGSEKVDPKAEKSPTISELLSAENGDRKQLYGLLAKDLKTTAAEVAKQNGLRNVNNADPDHWLQLEDGRWVQRKDIKAKPEEEAKPPAKEPGKEKRGSGDGRGASQPRR